ncbi:hypothetical protein CI109_107020 [Kwoniella shandongensis]|uniref:Uncharacterized protein n=1 Tax=Kwoniella shandongensis TaxID=1734106 RepID=A0A5M6BQR9_9TREE|nr:uncharacterized protein CI109_007323 [Kwoniella shandongensis]KAA5524340.1 hypothetical protein CI109_007323 [Kwoniella shandongensis]
MPAIHQFSAPPLPSSSKSMPPPNSSTSPLQAPSSSSVSPTRLNGHVNDTHRDIDESEDMHLDEGSEADTESEDGDNKPVVHVEVRLYSDCTRLPLLFHTAVISWIEESVESVRYGSELRGWEELRGFQGNVERIYIEEGTSKEGDLTVQVAEADFEIHVYRPSEEEIEEFTADLDEDDDEEKVSAASVRPLPSIELDGVWDTLVYSDDIKSRLLNYIYSTVFFSESDIDFNVVAWNRVILLHGPPGTGKTSLCRALAQKILIRLSQRYTHGKLIEINSHSLFSKWFSESGKLVQKLFQNVTDMVDDDQCFVVVMIDEVESLTAARAGAMTGNEPSDALRVVNALLTQLDKLRTRKNVLVLTTSNLLGAIDEAFISRVDLQEYVPLPPPQAIYTILFSIIREMMKKGMIKHIDLPSWGLVKTLLRNEEWRESPGRSAEVGKSLAKLAEKCYSLELSGRTLRKLPVLAHTQYLTKSRSSEERPRRVERWIEAMDKYVDLEVGKKRGDEERRKKEEEIQARRRGGGGGAAGSANGQVNGHGRTPSLDRSEVGLLTATKARGDDHHHLHK